MGKIEELTGLKRSQTQIRKYLLNIGFKCRQVGVIPAKANVEQHYQKCQVVLQLAQQLEIKLLFLPPYSPNLNLIERLWKWVKRQVLYSKYYDNLSDFKEVIQNCLSQTNTTYKAELSSFITLNFQSLPRL